VEILVQTISITYHLNSEFKPHRTVVSYIGPMLDLVNVVMLES